MLCFASFQQTKVKWKALQKSLHLQAQMAWQLGCAMKTQQRRVIRETHFFDCFYIFKTKQPFFYLKGRHQN